MYLTYVRHKIKDYVQWKKAFDHNANLLFKKHGMINTFVVRANDDPTDIIIINTWPSKQHWDDFGAEHEKPENKGKFKTPEDGGVVGEVEFVGGSVVE